VEHRIKGKKLIINLQENLRPNTTYTFSFGSSIADITENNIQSGYKYVFSTGDYLDSLSITGEVRDSYTGLPEEGLVAMLYSWPLTDSAVYKNKPDYYVYTDASGGFSVENLAVDTFALVVIKDENLNLNYNPGIDKIAFGPEFIFSGQQVVHKLRSFAEVTDVRMLGGEQESYGLIRLSFSSALVEPVISVIGLDESVQKREINPVQINSRGDTISFWYNPQAYPKDLRQLYLKIDAANFSKDSVRISIREIKQLPFIVQPKKISVLTPNDSVVLLTATPVQSIDSKRFLLISNGDSLIPEIKKTNHHSVTILKNPTLGKSYELVVLQGALTDFFGRENDSLMFKFKCAAEDELAIVRLRLNATDNKNKIVEWTDEKGNVLYRNTFKELFHLDMKDRAPGKYGIRIIHDKNNNGKWDAGDYKGKRQPEEVVYYPKPIELRSNWELEVVWDVPDFE
jgi:hypothetical protein